MTNGQLPFLGATENNNGITGFTDITTINQWSKTGNSTDNTLNKKKFGPNWLAVTNNGSVGNVYFMETTYTSSHDVTSLSLKNKNINKEIGLFLSSILKEAGKPFSYGRKWRPKRMRTTPILLPLDKDKMPDWNYMEQYIVNIMKTIEVPKLEPIKSSNLDLNSLNWTLMPISKVFESIKRGKRLTKSEQQSGTIPYISSTALNNGVDGYISIPNKRYRSFANFIGVNNSGSVGRAFYHEYSTIVSDHVTALSHRKLNKYNAPFLIACLEQSFRGNFSFNREISDNRFSRQKIMIPLTIDGDVDWQFMEDYIKSISNSHLI